jgi:hypothetical protein
VLGADRPAALQRQLEHRVVDSRVVGVGSEHVDVHVAIAEVAEQDHALAAGRLDHARDLVEESVEPVQRHPDVELVWDPDRVDRVRMSLAQRPQALPARGVIGDERIADPGVLERVRELFGRVRPRRALRQDVERRAGRNRRLTLLVIEHELEAVVEEEVTALQRRRVRAQ